MILSVHLIAGAALGAKVHNLWLLFLASLVLHFIVDALPHWEYSTDEIEKPSKKNFLIFAAKVSTDLLFGLFIVFFFFRQSPYFFHSLFGAFVSLLPDGFLFLAMILPKRFKRLTGLLKKINAFHYLVHFKKNKKFPIWGITTEIALITAIIIIIWRLSLA